MGRRWKGRRGRDQRRGPSLADLSVDKPMNGKVWAALLQRPDGSRVWVKGMTLTGIKNSLPKGYSVLNSKPVMEGPMLPPQAEEGD